VRPHSHAHSPNPAAAVVSRLPRLSAAQWTVIAIFFLYSALFAYESSFVINGIRYFCLFDDEMISMRYAANLVHHHVLAWNPGGERVLGFTNPLWVLYMAILHLFPIPPSKISLAVQVTGAILMALALILSKSITEHLFPGRRHAATIAMLLVAFYGPLANWSLQGTEVSLLTLLVCASAMLALRAAENESGTAALYVVLGMGTLGRVDMAVFAASLLLALALVQPRRWTLHLLGGGSIVFSFLLAQGAFNFGYYGGVLPNTYYLKMTGYPAGQRILHGASSAGHFMVPLVPLIGAVLFCEIFVRRSRKDWILILPVVAQVAYSIWVGGDAWEDWGGANRYVAIVMPLFLILAAFAVDYFTDEVSGWMNSRRGVVEYCALAGLAGLALFLGNRQHLLSRLLLQKPMQTSRPESQECNEDMVRQALLLRSLTDPGARIAVVWAGSIPYFSDRYAIDLLGKNDAKIAHEPMKVNSEFARKWGFYPGHLKWDYAYSIGELRPDVVAQLWAVEPGKIPWLKDYRAVTIDGFLWYVRGDSPNLRPQLRALMSGRLSVR
jgi:arabinofuranosyltransferase